MPVDVPTLELPRSLGRALEGGHPWVYRDHVPRGFRAESGSWLRVSAGDFRGFALWDADSPIALRVVAAKHVPDAAWVRERVEQAWQLRALVRESDTTAYRWLHGEGDGLPGVSVDLYGEHAVIVTYADSLDALVPSIVDALGSVRPLRGIAQRKRGARGSDEERLHLLRGALPPADLVVREHGLSLHANLHVGQKTGLFLDQRENRRFLGGVCAGRRVLNLFSYTGAFSLYAARGGAPHVTSVDSAAPAAEAARRNFEINGLAADGHEFVVADCFDWLERAQAEHRQFGLVICDPPSFARSRAQLPQALKAYTKINTLGLRCAEPGALYAASSCTAQVSPEAFRELLAEAARRAKRTFQIIHEAGQPIDHPVLAQHPEGRYLKFVVGRVLRA